MKSDPPHLSVIAMGLPIPQGSKRIVGAQRLGVARAQLIDVNGVTLKHWRKTVAEAAQEAMALHQWSQLRDVPIACYLAFTMQPPKDLAKRIAKAPTLPAPCHKTPDIDKLCRAVLDALTIAGVWHDDRHVARLTASKSYAGGFGAMAEPGLLATIKEWRP